ncbi:MAG: hypothetical protein QM765_09210 [Myxococcales bacterium]
MMTTRSLCQHDAPDLLERWRQVVRAARSELAAAPPGARHAWAEARARAEAVVAVLEHAAVAEKEANRAWREARAAERRAPPALRLVR